jgi:cob(I)alamin adenosyltransferase
MLYTGKGDGGESGLYATKSRLPKDSPIYEALGTVDELNTLLGVCRNEPMAALCGLSQGRMFDAVIRSLQEDLFVIQAELAGSEKRMSEVRVRELEADINRCEELLPPIKSFLVPGATRLSALLDHARTVARRAERRAVALGAEFPLSDDARTYLNRLSSMLYALARLAAYLEGGHEAAPTYRS